MTDTQAVSCEAAQAVLAVPLPADNDAGAATIHDYLIKLLMMVWEEGECFDGKRPFGNSSWEYDLYGALARAHMITVTWDEWGGIDRFTLEEEDLAIRLIRAAILELDHPSSCQAAATQE